MHLFKNGTEGAPAIGGWLAGSSPDASSSLAAFHSRLAGNAPVQESFMSMPATD